MVLSVADAKKLTVPRLKEELASRGLDNTGNKPELLARLTESIEQVGKEGKFGNFDEKIAKNPNFLEKKQKKKFFLFLI